MTKSLPEKPSLAHLRKQAKSLLKAHRICDVEALEIFRHLSRFSDSPDEEVVAASVSLAEAQYALAMEYGFKSWAELKEHVEAIAASSKETEQYQALKSEFFSAIRENRLDDVAEILEQNPALANATIEPDDLLGSETDCQHVLHYSASIGSTKLVRLLLKHGADVLRYGSDYKIPLHEAIEGRFAECVRLLLDHGSPTHFMWWDAMEHAEGKADEKIIQLIKDRRIKEGNLTHLISEGALEKATEVIEQDGSLANLTNNSHGQDKSPLMLASENGDVGLVELLISKGADVKATYYASQRNALTLAIYEEHDEVIRILKEHGAVSDDVLNFHHAARKGNLRKVKYYVNKGVDVNAKDSCDHHVLPNAFWSGNRKVVEYLVEQGADLNQSNGHGGYLWLSQYMEVGDIETVEYALKLGYDANNHDIWGHTLLQTAKEYGQKEIEQLLIEYGAKE